MSDLMTMGEAAELAEAEQVIERGIQTFTEVGNALLKIRDGRLYRAEFGTFEDYCRERWDLSRSRAYRLMTAAEVVSPIGDTDLPLPTNEGQARELARVPEPERADVWRETVERTGGKPTAAAIRETYRPAPEPAPAALEPEGTHIVGTPEPGIWYGGPAEPEPAPAPASTRSSAPPPMTDEERQERLRLVAKQESLNAWNQANDGLTAALSYAKTYTPPDDTDIYATVHDFKRRLKELAAITENWRDAS